MSPKPTVANLRMYAVARALSAPRDLEAAIRALAFVQIDPIRAPARAQDLILRHRVTGYRDGDLQRRYTELSLAEDHIHVYGVMPRDVRHLLHPRAATPRWRVEKEHPRLAAKIVAHIARHGPTHPRELQRVLGGASIVNGWGGQSAATTRMLEALHYRGTLHIARRVQGVRVYDLAPTPSSSLSKLERAEGVLRLLVQLYAPLSESTLRALAWMALGDTVTARRRAARVDEFVKSTAVSRADIDGSTYVWPADEEIEGETANVVRLLAPFDPLVWDRRRFEHFWGWPYRFEAYMPSPKRRFGYYALPLLWSHGVIGWANIAVKNDALVVGMGFAGARPRAVAFRRELDAELARVAAFLGVSHRPTITE